MELSFFEREIFTFMCKNTIKSKSLDKKFRLCDLMKELNTTRYRITKGLEMLEYNGYINLNDKIATITEKARETKEYRFYNEKKRREMQEALECVWKE